MDSPSTTAVSDSSRKAPSHCDIIISASTPTATNTSSSLHRQGSSSQISLSRGPSPPSTPNNASTTNNADGPPANMTPLHEILFVGLLCSAQFATQMSLNNTLAILHIIGSSLQIHGPGVLSWFMAGYSLTVGSFILISGRFGDVYGFKRMLVVGFLWFGVWNVVGGCSVYGTGGGGGEVLFIVSRVMAGMGPAVLLPNALGLLGATYLPGKRKNMVFALFGACAPGGAVVGGLFAGLWTLVWWPYTFWTFGIAMFVLALLAVFILPTVHIAPEIENLSFKEKFGELDLMGATVGITSMILFNFAWNQAPGFGWDNIYIWVALIVGILMFPVFFWVEYKIALKPLIPFGALSPDVSFVLACMCFGWASFGIWVFYLYQFLQIQRHASPLLTIAQISPVAVSGLLAGITSGRIISRTGPGWVMLIAMCAFLVGNILLATAPVAQTYWAQTFLTTLVMPWGMDFSFPAGTLILSNAVAKKHQGMGASLVNTVVNYSISIGVGIAGTVEVHTNRGGETTRDVLRGYRSALYLAIGVSGLGVAVAVGLLVKMRGEERRGREDDRMNMEKRGEA